MNIIYCLLLWIIPLFTLSHVVSSNNNSNNPLEIITHVAGIISSVWQKAGNTTTTRMLRDLSPAVIVFIFLRLFVIKNKNFDYNAFLKILTHNAPNKSHNDPKETIMSEIKTLDEKNIQAIFATEDNHIIFENTLKNHEQLLESGAPSKETINNEDKKNIKERQEIDKLPVVKNKKRKNRKRKTHTDNVREDETSKKRKITEHPIIDNQSLQSNKIIATTEPNKPKDILPKQEIINHTKVIGSEKQHSIEESLEPLNSNNAEIQDIGNKEANNTQADKINTIINESTPAQEQLKQSETVKTIQKPNNPIKNNYSLSQDAIQNFQNIILPKEIKKKKTDKKKLAEEKPASLHFKPVFKTNTLKQNYSVDNNKKSLAIISEENDDVLQKKNNNIIKKNYRDSKDDENVPLKNKEHDEKAQLQRNFSVDNLIIKNYGLDIGPYVKKASIKKPVKPIIKGKNNENLKNYYDAMELLNSKEYFEPLTNVEKENLIIKVVQLAPIESINTFKFPEQVIDAIVIHKNFQLEKTLQTNPKISTPYKEILHQQIITAENKLIEEENKERRERAREEEEQNIINMHNNNNNNDNEYNNIENIIDIEKTISDILKNKDNDKESRLNQINQLIIDHKDTINNETALKLLNEEDYSLYEGNSIESINSTEIFGYDSLEILLKKVLSNKDTTEELHDDFYKNLISSDKHNIENDNKDNSVILKLLVNKDFDDSNLQIFKEKVVKAMGINHEEASESEHSKIQEERDY